MQIKYTCKYGYYLNKNILNIFIGRLKYLLIILLQYIQYNTDFANLVTTKTIYLEVKVFVINNAGCQCWNIDSTVALSSEEKLILRVFWVVHDEVLQSPEVVERNLQITSPVEQLDNSDQGSFMVSRPMLKCYCAKSQKGTIIYVFTVCSYSNVSYNDVDYW